MLNLIKNYPALLSGLVLAVLGLLLAFGVNVTQSQTAAIMGVVGAILAILTHLSVTPNPPKA